MNFNFEKLVKKRRINLILKGLCDDGLDILYKVIGESTVLEALSLSNNNLTLSDGKLADAIAKNTTLKELNLRRNKINLKGIEQLADALKENNKTIVVLYLGDNNIGDEGAKCIADVLAVNKSLQDIDLSSNNINLEGAKYLADALKENDTLKELAIDKNNIGNGGAAKLAEALQFNHSIKTLELDFNNISVHDDPMMREMAMLQSFTEMKDHLNSALKEKESALKVNASMKAELKEKDAEIALLKSTITNKNKEIKSLKDATIKGQTIDDPVDLTKDDNKSSEPPNKLPRNEDTPKLKSSKPIDMEI